MDTTIRNIDEEAYRRLRTWAAYQGIPVGEALSRLVLDHVKLPAGRRQNRTLWSLRPWDWGLGTEDTSRRIDDLAYGDTP